MKKFAVIFAVLFVAFVANAFAVVHDNTTPAAGTGHFDCTIIAPLTISSPGEINLGVFVKNPGSPYTITTEDLHMDFVVGGESGYGFYYKITQDVAGTNADITLTWTQTTGGAPVLGTTTGATLVGTAYTFTCTVNTVDAKAVGTEAFPQQVEVGYNTF